ncbi:MAG: hypothetical protein HYZ23_10545 [Chloroflexi bacterium]|nr:hypothetical protein [Chloroflexota bacterium]
MESSAPVKPARLNLLSRIMDNPVIAKELKGRMRGGRSFILISAYLALISLFIGLIYTLLATDGTVSNGNPEYLQIIGKMIFSIVVLLELLMISFIGPALTAGAISSERERQTFDLLRTSLLSSGALVFGKLGSAVVFLLLLIFAAIPVQSMAFFLGGVGMAEMVVSTLMLVVTAVFYCSLGIFFSSFSKRTLNSTVLAYGSILLSFIFLFFFLFVLGIFGSSSLFDTSFTEDATQITLWFVFSTNPFFAAVASEMILVEDQSLFYTSNGFFGSTPIPLLSPWIIYISFRVGLTILLILLSVYFVNRPDK